MTVAVTYYREDREQRCEEIECDKDGRILAPPKPKSGKWLSKHPLHQLDVRLRKLGGTT